MDALRIGASLHHRTRDQLPHLVAEWGATVDRSSQRHLELRFVDVLDSELITIRHLKTPNTPDPLGRTTLPEATRPRSAYPLSAAFRARPYPCRRCKTATMPTGDPDVHSASLGG